MLPFDQGMMAPYRAASWAIMARRLDFLARMSMMIAEMVNFTVYMSTLDGQSHANVSRDSRDKVVEFLILGLTTDGAHHKQWALEQAFLALCEDDYVEQSKKEFEWEEGISP
jgi:hypothetical protein